MAFHRARLHRIETGDRTADRADGRHGPIIALTDTGVRPTDTGVRPMMFEETDELDGLHPLHVMSFYELALYAVRKSLESVGPVTPSPSFLRSQSPTAD